MEDGKSEALWQLQHFSDGSIWNQSVMLLVSLAMGA